MNGQSIDASYTCPWRLTDKAVTPGYRPHGGVGLTANRQAIATLLAKLHDPNLEIGALAELVNQGVIIRYKLLRSLNSALYVSP